MSARQAAMKAKGGSSPTQKRSLLIPLLQKFLIIVVSGVIVFTALKNSLTYLLQQYIGTSENVWQQGWNYFLNTFGDDSFALLVIGPNAVGYILYWSIGLSYTFMDVTGRPKFLRKYKTQAGKNEPVDKWMLLKAIGIVHFNILVVSIMMSMGFSYLMDWRGYNNARELPSFHWTLFELAVFALIEEVGFYYSHRLFHHRLLYKHFHKLHHEWQAPIAIIAAYAHPLEHIIANLSPILLGPLVMGSHPSVAWLWYGIAIISTLNDHSGYHFPLFPSPEAHDYHHLKFTECYGALGILDMLHGTDKKFRETMYYSRHSTLWSLTSARESYPDDKETKMG